MDFDLDPGRVHLNHGAFGAVPRRVREGVVRRAAEVERNPHRYHRAVVADRVRHARGRAARFLHHGADDIALVRNVSEGVATVVASLDLRPGDEIVVTDHNHRGVRVGLEAAARRKRARVVEVPVPLDAGEDRIVAGFAEAVGPRTRLVMVDQITSATAVLNPVAGVAAVVRAVNPEVLVLVDAAHVPGQVDVDPATLGVDFWTGNLYKWAFTPRGAGVLWVAERHRADLRPLVASWGGDEPFPVPWDHPGNQDFGPWLAIPDALDFFEAVGGWERVRRSADLVTAGAAHVAETLGTTYQQVPPRPAPTMRLVPLPDGVVTSAEDAAGLYERLSTEHGVEAGPVCFGGRGYVRVSGQVYNRADDYQRLADALTAIVR